MNVRTQTVVVAPKEEEATNDVSVPHTDLIIVGRLSSGCEVASILEFRGNISVAAPLKIHPRILVNTETKKKQQNETK